MEKILITGGTGFLGRELAKQLKPNFEVFIGGRNNTQNSFAQMSTGCESFPLDITSVASVKDAFTTIKPDHIIHAAATKFVDISEKEPFEAIDINVIGSENIARAAIEYNCKIVIGISTDKAAPPISNTYALTKSLMERMFCSINKRTQTRFTNVRFGNIAWSSGSALPIWTKMVNQNGKIQSTGSHMRRYMTTVKEAAELVIRSFNNIEDLQGGVLIHDMKSVQISDLLDAFCEINNSTWEKISPRPGEREDEYLLGEPELPYSKEVFFDNIRHFFFTPNILQSQPVNEVLSTKNAPRFSYDELVKIVQNAQE